MIGKFVAFPERTGKKQHEDQCWHLAVVTDPEKGLSTIVKYNLDKSTAKLLEGLMNGNIHIEANVPVVLSQEVVEALRSGEIPSERRLCFYDKKLLEACGNGGFKKVHLVLAE